MYAVLERCVLTQTGMGIVREHHHDGNAQLAYKELCEAYKESTKGDILAVEIHEYIANADLLQWKGNTENFILHFKEKCRLYHTIVGPDDKLSPHTQMTFLQKAVKAVPEFASIKQTASQLKTGLGKKQTYDDYCVLLLNAARDYDKTMRTQGSATKRRIYGTHMATASDYDDDDSFDMDTPVTTIQAFRASMRPEARMTKESWYALSKEEQDIWDMLPDKAKAIILGESHASRPSPAFKPRAPSTRPNNPRFAPRRPTQHTMSEISAADFLTQLIQVQSTDVSHAPPDNPPSTSADGEDVGEDSANASDDLGHNLYMNLTQTSLADAPAGHIVKLLSKPYTRPPESVKPKPSDSVKSKARNVGFDLHMTHLTYNVSKHVSNRKGCSVLCDRGANGCVIGKEMRPIDTGVIGQTVNIRAFDKHEQRDVPLVTAGAVVQTHKGEVIAIVHHGAHMPVHNTILSCGQLEYWGQDVNDKSRQVPGGLQRIRSKEGYCIPMDFRDGLPFISMRPFTNAEWDTLPHMHLVDPHQWDPSVLDYDATEGDDWYDAMMESEEYPDDNLFSLTGDYKNTRHANQAFMDALRYEHEFGLCISVNKFSFFDEDPFGDSTSYNVMSSELEPDPETTATPPETRRTVHGPKHVKRTKTDYSKYRAHFLYAPLEIIQKTFDLTTQYARLPVGDVLRRTFKTPFPLLNVQRREEAVYCDQIFSDTPAIFGGETSASIFAGRESRVKDVYGMKTGRDFPKTLEDNVTQRGAMTILGSDRANIEISKRVKEFLRSMLIKSWQSEPHKQNQNFVEREYQDVKKNVNTLMDRTGSPASTWLLCLIWVCFVMNHTYNKSIDGIPMERLTGISQDISPMLCFEWWEPVYYMSYDHGYPSESREARGRFVGVSENVGHAMTFKILTDDTQVVIHRSNVRSARKTGSENMRIDPVDGEKVKEVVKLLSEEREREQSSDDTMDDGTEEHAGAEPPEAPDPDNSKSREPRTFADEFHDTQPTQIPYFEVEDLIGRTFLMKENEKGEIHRARIADLIDEHDQRVERNSERIKFRCSVNNDQYEEILTYNELLEHLNKDAESEHLWKFRRIVAHHGPFKRGDKDYLGSKYNVLIEWENGETSSEPIATMTKDDPITLAIYAQQNDLLDTEGWKHLRRFARRAKQFKRMINQVKLRSYNSAKRYQYGVEVPRNYEDAIRLDVLNKNTMWQDAIAKEMGQIQEYEVFKDNGYNEPRDHKKIKVHLVFACKHDGRRKARLVADGHLTEVPLESVYSGVVSMRSLRIMVFLAELNKLELWATDIGNAYLEARTKEKLYIKAGPEFGPLQGHILIIERALYGLRTSGARWHERFADCLRNEGFQPCKAEPDIWMRRNGDIYEYIAVYVDDLAIGMRDPKAFVDILEKKYHFKLSKDTGPIQYHLGLDFIRDADGTLRLEPKKFIQRLVDSYERLFGSKPKHASSPLEKGDHPELDTSELLEAEDISKFQSLIGSLQWTVTLARFDIATAVMGLSSFRAAPRRGHMQRLCRICGYIYKFKNAAIRIRVDEPDMSDVPETEYDWSHSVYGDVKEQVPQDAPPPLGRYVTLTHYVDANLMHCVLTGRSVTGVLHLMNKTPIDWFSKKQATVETATFGSEFVAARTAVEQIMDLRLTLRYLGVPIRDKSYLFGDNMTVVNSSTQPHGKLHKRHTMLSFHRVREAIASKMISFTHLPGEFNPADILSKHWGYTQVWPSLQALLFYFGDTASLLETNSGETT